MDIYSYIKKDHRKVADLMEQVAGSTDAQQRQQLFRKIKEELTLHADSEEKTFYQAIIDGTRSKKVEDKIEHADEEHGEIREYLTLISESDPASEEWLMHFGELKHAVEHHVEEEEGEIFEKAKTYIDPEQAKQLAKDMDKLKKAMMAEMTVAAE